VTTIPEKCVGLKEIEVGRESGDEVFIWAPRIFRQVGGRQQLFHKLKEAFAGGDR
jgi:hypothetical protein